MSFINFETNIDLNENQILDLKKEFGELISLIKGKSEDWLMVNIENKKTMYFKGSDEACVFIEVKVYGEISEMDIDSFTKKITDYISTNFSIFSSRIYVSYFKTPLWGYNGVNF